MQKRWLCISLGLALSGTAHAQDAGVPTFNAQSYRPPIDSRATLWADDSGLGQTNVWTARMSLGYAKRVLSLTSAATGETAFLVDDLVQVDLLGGTTFGRVRVGLDVPIFPLISSEITESQTGLGDVGLDVRATLIEASESSVGFAVAARVTGPTATVDLPLSTGGLGYEATAIVDYQSDAALLAVNIGYRGVPATELDAFTIDDQLVTRVGVGLPVGEEFGVSADLAGNLQPNQPLDNVANAAVEGLAGMWYRPNRHWVMRFGSGGGLTEGIGSPMLRTVFMVGYEPEADGDADGDGFLDSVDPCPDKAEDMDGWDDDDGCPESKSPVRILMRDPYGNPVDEALVQISSEQGEPLEDGGPQMTIGLEPGLYLVKARAKGFDDLDEEFVVQRGKAVDLVKAMNPNKPPPPVRVTRKAIRISQKVYFQTNIDVLKPESHRILNLVAKTMKARTGITKVQIVGHTDSRADDVYNKRLSVRRAQTVRRYLIAQGVDASRLEAVGKGESEPLDARETESAWELNRRVEFVILKRD